jgi:hypothetical protein
MPVIRDIPLSLELREVLRREGFREYSKIRPEMERLVRELLAGIGETHLLEPALAYEIFPVAAVSHQKWPLEELMPGAEALAAVVGTIGPGLENRVKNYFSRGEPLRGVLLDGLGSAAVDALTQEACKLVASEALSRGYQSSSPISPGMPGLPITEQRPLLELVPAREIGVSLTPAGVMVPRKSASMIIGLGKQMKTWTRAEVCARCHLGKTCLYRIHK